MSPKKIYENYFWGVSWVFGGRSEKRGHYNLHCRWYYSIYENSTENAMKYCSWTWKKVHIGDYQRLLESSSFLYESLQMGKQGGGKQMKKPPKHIKKGELQFQDLATTPFPLWSYERLQRRRKKVAAESQTSETWRGGCSGGRWQTAFPYGWCFWVDHHLNPHLLCQCLKGLPSRAAFTLNGGLNVGHPTSL